MDKEIMKGLRLLSVTVVVVFGSTGVGVGLGYLAWKKGGAPWWVLPILTLVGFAHGIYRLYQNAK